MPLVDALARFSRDIPPLHFPLPLPHFAALLATACSLPFNNSRQCQCQRQPYPRDFLYLWVGCLRSAKRKRKTNARAASVERFYCEIQGIIISMQIASIYRHEASSWTLINERLHTVAFVSNNRVLFFFFLFLQEMYFNHLR